MASPCTSPDGGYRFVFPQEIPVPRKILPTTYQYPVTTSPVPVTRHISLNWTNWTLRSCLFCHLRIYNVVSFSVLCPATPVSYLLDAGNCTRSICGETPQQSPPRLVADTPRSGSGGPWANLWLEARSSRPHKQYGPSKRANQAVGSDIISKSHMNSVGE